MTTRNERVHGIIHTAAVATGAVGAGMAQVPGSDLPVIAGLQTTMIMAIGHEHDVSLTRGTAADLLLTFTSAARFGLEHPGARGADRDQVLGCGRSDR